MKKKKPSDVKRIPAKKKPSDVKRIPAKKKPTAIDLFAGAGGFSLGVGRAGFNVVVAVEIDKWAAKTYRRNLKGTIVLEEDITKITVARLLKIAGLKKRELGLLFGGPPCQGFTTANLKRGLDNPKSKLMHEFIRMVKGTQPKIFYIENVPGLFSYKDFFILLMETLEKCGYVVRCLMMDAASYGVPQHRKRIFIQGIRKDLKILPTFPTPTHFEPEKQPKDKLKQPKDKLKQSKDKALSIPRSMVAIECFATNGFPKEEVKDLYWNKILCIQMNKKTAAFAVERAIGKIMGKAIKYHLEKQ